MRKNYKVVFVIATKNKRSSQFDTKMFLVDSKCSKDRTINYLKKHYSYFMGEFDMFDIHTITRTSMKRFPGLSKQVNEVLDVACDLGENTQYTRVFDILYDTLYDLYVGNDYRCKR